MSDGSRSVMPHRGTMILVFGILGIVMCPPLGIAAWVMGATDLAAMQRGDMDRSGEDMTRAGKICGIISVALWAIGFLIYFAIAVLFVSAAAVSVR